MGKTEQVISVLKAEDIFAKEVTINKNGHIYRGITLADQTVSPVVYIKDTDTIEQIVDKAKALFRLSADIDPTDIFNPEYILQNSFICLQKPSNDQIVKKMFLNLEMYIRIRIKINEKKDATTKVTPGILAISGLEEEDVWKAARRNTASDLTMAGMNELLGLPEGCTPMFDVFTTKSKLYGAAGLAYPDLFRKYCYTRKINVCYILPSSIHEVLIIGDDILDGRDPKGFVRMVAEVNDAEVNPEEQLLPAVYKYDVNTNAITIVAVLE